MVKQLVRVLVLCFCLTRFIQADEMDLKKETRRLRNSAEDAVMKKEYSKALEAYDSLITLEKDNPKNYYKRTGVYEKMRKYKQALSDLNTALELDDQYTSAYNLRGRIYFTLGKCSEAVKDYETVLRLKPTHGDAKKMLPKATDCRKMLEQIERVMNPGRWHEAERLLDKAIDLIGKAPYLLYLRAQARYELGKFYESIADAGAILKIEKDNVDALLLRAKGYYRVTEHDMAQRHIREIMRYDPENEKTKEFSRKLKALLKYDEEGDKAFNMHKHDGLLQAVEYYTKAIEVDPGHRDYIKLIYVKLCRCYAKLKLKKETQIACENAIQIDSSLIDAYTLYAELLSKTAKETSQFEEALRAWQRAFEVQGNNQHVREGMKKAEVALKQSKTKNYYKILGVERDADGTEIKKAYRKKAKELHPDMHQAKSEGEQREMEKQFQEVAEAYEVLSDDELRAKYDRGEEVFENQGNSRRSRHHGFPFPFGRHGGGTRFHFNF